LKIHERIRALRKAKGVSQTFIADKTGMSIANYNMKENGKRTIAAEELELIAIALGEPISNFFDKKLNEKLNIDSTRVDMEVG